MAFKPRNAFFTLCLIALSYLCVEAFSFALYDHLYGEHFSFAAMDKRRAEALGTADPQTDDLSSDSLVPHPYTGYVLNPEKDPGNISAYGYRAAEDPMAASANPHNAIVAITGGSVAEFVYMYAAPTLQEYLEKFPQFQGRKVVLISLGISAYKQPQQLFAVEYYLLQGGRLDMLINLDGFNEATYGFDNQSHGISPGFPYYWPLLFLTGEKQEYLPELGNVMIWKHARRLSARAFAPLRFSVTATTLWSLLDRYENNGEIDAQNALASKGQKKWPYFMTGPDTLQKASVKEIAENEIRFWEQGSIQFAQLGRTYGFSYFHFLQPNQYVPDSKILTEEEKTKAYDPENPRRAIVVLMYPKLERHLETLRAQGIDATSLTGIYSQTKETIYSDPCCHVNALGNEMLARAIGEHISEYFAAHPPAPITH